MTEQHPLFQNVEQIRRRRGKVRDTAITLAHGSGGKAMRDLIDEIFVGSFDNPILSQLEDQVSFSLATLMTQGDRLAFTTDSYVVDRLFFPGNEGKLVVVVPRSHSEAVLSAMQSHPLRKDSCIVGEVIDSPSGVVLLQTAFGAEPIVDMLVGDQLPRIC